LVQEAFEGINTCLLAYGITGSGKSYSMMGSPPNEGIVPMICQAIVDKLEWESAQVQLKIFEIYNEKVHDLMVPPRQRPR
jgi:hypothetical protein